MGLSTFGRWPLLLAVASYPLVLVSGCICTLIGGSDGLVLDVEVTGGRLPGGDYTIVARVEGVEVRVDEMLSESGGGASVGGTPEAVVGEHHLFIDGVVFAESGMIMVGFRDGGGPAEVAIEVWRGASMLVQQTYKPKYMEYRPNGNSCPPELEQARDRLVIAAPTS